MLLPDELGIEVDVERSDDLRPQWQPATADGEAEWRHMGPPQVDGCILAFLPHLQSTRSRRDHAQAHIAASNHRQAAPDFCGIHDHPDKPVRAERLIRGHTAERQAISGQWGANLHERKGMTFWMLWARNVSWAGAVESPEPLATRHVYRFCRPAPTHAVPVLFVSRECLQSLQCEW